MKESKNNVPIMYQKVPAVAAMNRVPGFEPLKLLRRTKSRNSNEVVLKLDLPYKKLWFRLANPNGRIRLNVLRITEQLAIYEAQVFLDRNDTEPISSFTASCAREDATAEDYIRAAQEAATDEALSMAGYGIQFADVEMTKDKERYGSEIPLSAASIAGEDKSIKNMPARNLPSPAVPDVKPTVNTAVFRKTLQTNTTKGQNIQAASSTQHDTKQLSSVAVPVVHQVIEQNQLSISEAKKDTTTALPIAQVADRIPSEETMSIQEKDALPIPDPSEESLPIENTVPKYTQNTPVEEIIHQMTLQEAQSVVVDTGTCEGWTLAEVAEKRRPSLKFYVYGGYKGTNNILRAGAKIMLDYLETQKAG